MRLSRFALCPLLLLAASCSSPPRPPAVDESLRRPVNRPAMVELQTCRHELHNARLFSAEQAAVHAHEDATRGQLRAMQALLESSTAQAQPGRNELFRVRFGFASTAVAMPPEVAGVLLPKAKAAPLLVLKGRTDGTVDSAAEARVARGRAIAVRSYLVAAGVDPARIRVTYQPTGDFVGDNTTPEGRAANRRVDVEVYSALPIETARSRS